MQLTSDGWRVIFDGTSKEGWVMCGPGELKLENGVLVTYGGMGMLWYSKEKFGNCKIRVQFKLTTMEDNSGIFIRIPEPPNDPWDAVHKGYEIQICNHGGDWQRTGCLYSLTKALKNISPALGEWNTFVITLDGPITRVELNGHLITDYKEGDPVPEKTIWHEPDRGPRPNEGYIGLQNHDDKCRVHFREVAIKPLS